MVNFASIISDNNIPLEKRADGKLSCKLQRNEGNTTYCLENRRECKYIDTTVSLQKQEKVEGRDGRKGFYFCSLNCNSWFYKGEE